MIELVPWKHVGAHWHLPRLLFATSGPERLLAEGMSRITYTFTRYQ